MANLIEQLNISELKWTDQKQNHFETSMIMSDFHAQPLGYLNGGASLAFAEIIAGMASNQLLDNAYFAVGQSVQANHLNATVAKGILTAQAKLLHQGGRSHVWEIHCYDETDKLISQITVTNAIIKKAF